jgi:hypothetical protein
MKKRVGPMFILSSPHLTTSYSYNLAFGISFFNIASATFFLWILPVAVFGIMSVKNTYRKWLVRAPAR